MNDVGEHLGCRKLEIEEVRRRETLPMPEVLDHPAEAIELGEVVREG